MTKILVAYLVCVVSFLVLDGIWLTLIAKSFYRTRLGYLMADKPNLWAAGIFYLIFTISLMVFVIIPAISADNSVRALLLGGLFGLVTYATYDLTNHATVKDWPAIITLVDLCWGTALTAVVSFVTAFVMHFTFSSQG